MAIDPLTALFETGKMAIERIWPDANKRAEEIRKLEEIRQRGDLAALDGHIKLMLGQIEVNKVSAGHKSLFVAGGRPFIIWVGGIGMAYQFLLFPLLTWIWALAMALGGIPDTAIAPPPLDVTVLFTMLGGLLGFGAYRSIDKFNKVETNKLG